MILLTAKGEHDDKLVGLRTAVLTERARAAAEETRRELVSRIEAGDVDWSMRQVELALLVDETVAAMRPEARARRALLPWRPERGARFRSSWPASSEFGAFEYLKPGDRPD